MLVIFVSHLNVNDEIEYPTNGLNMNSCLTRGKRNIEMEEYDLYAVCRSCQSAEGEMRRDELTGVWRMSRDEDHSEEGSGEGEETCVLFYKRRPRKRSAGRRRGETNAS